MDVPSLSASLPPDVVEYLLSFLDRTSDYVGVTDREGNVIYVNGATQELLGVAGPVPTKLTTGDLFPPAAFAIFFDQVKPVISRGEAWSGYVPVYGALGSIIEVWLTVVGDTDATGEVQWVATLGRGVAEWRKAQDELTRRATHDELTGLARRVLLVDRIGVALARVEREGGVVAAVFVDLDDLKTVNDVFGHHAGDAVLVEVANRMLASVRAVDAVARVGGDEFVVLFDGVDDVQEAIALTERVQAFVGATPIRVGGDVIDVSVSAGVAVSTVEDDAESLLRRADQAMYAAKHGVPRSVVVHDPVPAGGRRRLTGHDLALGVTQQSIVPYYQPVIDLTDGGTVGYQALARWSRPGEAVVAAAEFLDLADTSALGVSIDLAVMRQAIVEAARWRGAERPRLYVHVSSRFIAEPHMAYFVAEALRRAGLPPERLHVVMPERMVVRRTPVVAAAIAALREIGVRLVVSEVGVRQSAIFALAEQAFDELRVESTLVHGVPLDDVCARAVAGTVALAHGLGMRAQAVGVESSEQLDLLRELGCDLVQGFATGSPERLVPPTGR